MVITRNHSDLAEGHKPDTEVRFAHLLVEKWHRENQEAGRKPHAIPGTRFRHSDAGKCARALAYSAAGIEPSDPMDISGTWNTRLGTIIHDLWQEALQEAHPDAEVELKVQVFDDGSGHIDAIIRLADGKVIVYELKSQGGYGYKSSIGKVRQGTPAEGPKAEHVIQGALGGKAFDADEVVVGYLAKECLSVNVARGIDNELHRFAAEWTFTRDEYMPLADAEIKRVEGLLALLDKGELAARKVPGTPGEIVDPSRSRWELKDVDGQLIDTGSIWSGSYCSYCSFQTLCSRTAAGRIPVEQAVEIRASLP